jgi:hypothetical protein
VGSGGEALAAATLLGQVMNMKARRTGEGNRILNRNRLVADRRPGVEFRVLTSPQRQQGRKKPLLALRAGKGCYESILRRARMRVA